MSDSEGSDASTSSRRRKRNRKNISSTTGPSLDPRLLPPPARLAELWVQPSGGLFSSLTSMFTGDGRGTYRPTTTVMSNPSSGAGRNLFLCRRRRRAAPTSSRCPRRRPKATTSSGHRDSTKRTTPTARGQHRGEGASAPGATPPRWSLPPQGSAPGSPPNSPIPT